MSGTVTGTHGRIASLSSADAMMAVKPNCENALAA
jgi:hypothetical protein